MSRLHLGIVVGLAVMFVGVATGSFGLFAVGLGLALVNAWFLP